MMETIEKQPEHTPMRRQLPNDRVALVHDFTIGGHHVTLTTGEYEDGSLGEIFLQVNTEGSTLSGVFDAFATAVSIALQYGVPFEILAAKFIGSRFEPMGITSSKELRAALSIVDYVFRFLSRRYAKKEAA